MPNLKALTDNVFSKPDIVEFLKTEADENKVKERLQQLVTVNGQ